MIVIAIGRELKHRSIRFVGIKGKYELDFVFTNLTVYLGNGDTRQEFGQILVVSDGQL
jgi:hypothetical protein